jgi:Tfp pilus assembly protein PilF
MAQPNPDEVLARFAEARQAFREKRFERASELLEAIVADAPLFAPAIQLLAAARQVTEPEGLSDASARAALRDARALLERAAIISRRSPGVLNDLGHFLNAIEDAPADALPVFAEALRNGAHDLTEILDGLISCAQQLGPAVVHERLAPLDPQLVELRHRFSLLDQLLGGMIE